MLPIWRDQPLDLAAHTRNRLGRGGGMRRRDVQEHLGRRELDGRPASADRRAAPRKGKRERRYLRRDLADDELLVCFIVRGADVRDGRCGGRGSGGGHEARGRCSQERVRGVVGYAGEAVGAEECSLNVDGVRVRGRV